MLFGFADTQNDINHSDTQMWEVRKRHPFILQSSNWYPLHFSYAQIRLSRGTGKLLNETRDNKITGVVSNVSENYGTNSTLNDDYSLSIHPLTLFIYSSFLLAAISRAFCPFEILYEDWQSLLPGYFVDHVDQTLLLPIPKVTIHFTQIKPKKGLFWKFSKLLSMR